MLLASWKVTSRSSSSANSAPCAGCPLEKALRARSWVARMWSTPAIIAGKCLRLPGMPPAMVPPMFTPW